MSHYLHVHLSRVNSSLLIHLLGYSLTYSLAYSFIYSLTYLFIYLGGSAGSQPPGGGSGDSQPPGGSASGAIKRTELELQSAAAPTTKLPKYDIVDTDYAYLSVSPA
jgi:hypothetical protein